MIITCGKPSILCNSNERRNNLQIENGEIVVGVGVMRMRANGVVEAQLGLSDGQLFAAIAVVQVVSLGQQNGPQIVESTGVVGPQSAKQNKTNQNLLVVTKMCRD